MIRRTYVTAAVIAGAALGGAAIANAANSGSTSTSTSTTAPSSQMPGPYGPPGGHRDLSQGGHRANGKTETLLTGDTAAKVKAAAQAKVPGGTIERVETDADTGSPYEAHIRKSDGSEVIVYVDANFNVTGTGTMSHP